MRQLKCGLLAGAALLALASTAAASDLTLGFSGVKGGAVVHNETSYAAATDAAGQINGFVIAPNGGTSGSGGNVEAIVNITSSSAIFESGTATVGTNTQSISQSGIDILFSNIGDGTIALTPFGSTITPAGMGFYVQDRSLAAAGGNPFTGYGQSLTADFSDFFGVIGANTTFARAEFDFEVVNQVPNNDDEFLYTLSGFVSLSFDGNGNLVVDENLTGPEEAGQILNSFFTQSNHHALIYDWQATNIVIPLGGLLSGFSEQVVSYRANVRSWTQAPCINNGLNCIVAYSGFGDPVGRGGGVEEDFAASFGDVTPFDNDGGGDHDFVIGGLNFAPVTVNIFRSTAVPEPSTWAVMITGFGLAGAALRRRRRVAYT